MKLEDAQVTVRFFRDGSVDEVETRQDAANLAAAEGLMRTRYPQAVFLRCCEQEEDGGCVFVYPTPQDLTLDEEDMSRHASETRSQDTPANYGRWVGLIVAAENEQRTCARPPRPAQ